MKNMDEWNEGMGGWMNGMKAKKDGWMDGMKVMDGWN